MVRVVLDGTKAYHNDLSTASAKEPPGVIDEQLTVDSGLTGGEMSERNGEKSRFQINRKRAVLRRAKIRALVATSSTAGEKRPAHAKARPAKG